MAEFGQPAAAAAALRLFTFAAICFSASAAVAMVMLWLWLWCCLLKQHYLGASYQSSSLTSVKLTRLPSLDLADADGDGDGDLGRGLGDNDSLLDLGDWIPER